ncbi:MAG: hypothetical protein U5L04_11665 [Trueperaceae bacterium]|nr:hypothetical protein [Trueperaceae bacterium]
MSLHAAAAATPGGGPSGVLGAERAGRRSTLSRAASAGMAPVTQMSWPRALHPRALIGGERGVPAPPRGARRAASSPRRGATPGRRLTTDRVPPRRRARQRTTAAARQERPTTARAGCGARARPRTADLGLGERFSGSPRPTAALALWQASGLPLTPQARNTLATTIPKIVRDARRSADLQPRAHRRPRLSVAALSESQTAP